MNMDMDRLINFYTKQLVDLGINEERAFRMSKAQIEVHGFGTTTHGLPPLNSMIKDIKKNPSHINSPQIIKEFGALTTADCSETPNIEPILWGMDRAGEAAKDYGIGFTSLLNGGWVGTMGYHLSHWARKGYLMMSWTQTSNILFVNAFGGKEAKLNTNPLAFSFPISKSLNKLEPLVADFSTSAISMGKTKELIKSEEIAPEYIYQDRDGKSSNNPKVIKNGGVILPFGGQNYGFRGTSLALLIEAMTAAAGVRPANSDKEGGQNTHVLAINIDALGNLDDYHILIEDMMNWILESSPIDNKKPVRYPGQRGWNSLNIARQKGIEIQGDNLEKLMELGFK